MSRIERQHYSLASKTFRSTIMGAVILGLAALIIGLGAYTYALIHQYISEAFNLSKSAAAILQDGDDVEQLSKSIMTDYRAMTDEEREQAYTPEYRERYSHYLGRKDYKDIHKVLDNLAGAVEIDDIYIAVYDADSSALVYMADHDTNPET